LNPGHSSSRIGDVMTGVVSRVRVMVSVLTEYGDVMCIL
jgi:hypothetical protein